MYCINKFVSFNIKMERLICKWWRWIFCFTHTIHYLCVVYVQRKLGISITNANWLINCVWIHYVLFFFFQFRVSFWIIFEVDNISNWYIKIEVQFIHIWLSTLKQGHLIDYLLLFFLLYRCVNNVSSLITYNHMCIWMR